MVPLFCRSNPIFHPQWVMGNPLLGDPTSLPGMCIPGMWLQVLKSWKRGGFLLHPSTELPWFGPALPWRALLSRESFRAVQNHFPRILIALSLLEGPGKPTWGQCVLLRENVEEAEKIPVREGSGSLGSSSTGPLECALCSSEDGKPQGLSGEAIPLGTISLPLPPNPETSDFTTFL